MASREGQAPRTPNAVPALGLRLERGPWIGSDGRTSLVVGRGPSCDLRCADERVSDRHLSLQLAGDVWVAEDMGSTNGTYAGTERLGRMAIVGPIALRLGAADSGPSLLLAPRSVPAQSATLRWSQPQQEGPERSIEIPGEPRPPGRRGATGARRIDAAIPGRGLPAAGWDEHLEPGRGVDAARPAAFWPPRLPVVLLLLVVVVPLLVAALNGSLH